MKYLDRYHFHMHILRFQANYMHEIIMHLARSVCDKFAVKCRNFCGCDCSKRIFEP